MQRRNTWIIQNITIAILAAVTLTNPSLAADIVLTPPAGGRVSVIGSGISTQGDWDGNGGALFINAQKPSIRFSDTGSYTGAVSNEWLLHHSLGAFRVFENTGSQGTPTWSERLTLAPGGNVGIGTVNPLSGKLHVEGGSATGVYGNSSSNIGVFGNSSSGHGVNGNSSSGVGVIGSSNNSYGVRGISTNSYGVYGFSTNSYGVYGESTNSYSYAGYFQGNVYVTGTVTQHSDVRLKQGVRNLGYGLHDVMQLRPVSYTWKQTSNGREQLGLLAQEVEAVVPELVTTAHDAEQTKGINYMGLLPVMIKAMQEQQDIIISLKTENARLRQQDASLDTRIRALEQRLQQ